MLKSSKYNDFSKKVRLKAYIISMLDKKGKCYSLKNYITNKKNNNKKIP